MNELVAALVASIKVEGIEKVNRDINQFAQSMRKAAGDIKGHLDKNEADFRSWGQRVGQTIQDNAAQIRTAGRHLTVYGAALTGLVAKGGKDFIEFQRESANVSTMLSGTIGEVTGQMSVYERGIKNLSIEFNQSTTTLQRGLYDILSASIAPAQAMEVLKVSAEAATAGLTTVAIAADAITTVLNSYQYEAERASEVSDKLWGIVRRGKVTFDEVAGSIGKVAATAANVGLEFEQLGAAIATATRAGVRHNEAITGVNSILQVFLRHTDEQAEAARKFGIELSSNAIAAEGLEGVIRKLAGANDMNRRATSEEVVAIFRNIRAAKALMPILQDTAGFLEDVAFMHDAAGLSALAYAKMADTLGFQLGQLGKSMKIMLMEFFEPLVPIISRAVQALQGLLNTVRNISPTLRSAISTIALISGAFMTLSGILLMLAPGLVAVIGALSGPMVLAIGAVAAALIGGGGLVAALVSAGEEIRRAGDHISIFRAELEEQREETDRYVSNLTGLRDRYQQLREEIARTSDTEERRKKEAELQSVIRQIVDIAPEVVTAYDEMGRAIELDVEKVTEAIETKQRLYEIELQMSALRAEELARNLAKNKENRDREIEELRRRLEVEMGSLQVLMESYSDLSERRQQDLDNQKKSIQEGIEASEARIVAAEQEVARITEAMEERQRQLASGAITEDQFRSEMSAMAGLRQHYQAEIGKIREEIQKLQDTPIRAGTYEDVLGTASYDESMRNLRANIEATGDRISNLRDKLGPLEQDAHEYNRAVIEMALAMKRLADEGQASEGWLEVQFQTIPELREIYNDLVERGVDPLRGALGDLGETMGSLRERYDTFDDYLESLTAATESTRTWRDEVDELDGQIEELIGSLKEYWEMEEESIDTIEQRQKVEDELREKIEKRNEIAKAGLEEEQKEFDELVAKYREQMDFFKDQQNATTQTLIREVERRQAVYAEDSLEWKAYEELKVEYTRAAAGEITAIWGSLRDDLSGEFTGMFKDIMLGDTEDLFDDMAENFLDSFAGAFSQLISQALDFETMMGSTAGMIGAGVFALGQMGQEGVEQILDGLVSFIEQIPEVIAGIMEELPKIIETIVEKLPEILDAIIEAIPAIIDALIEGLPDIIMAILEAIPQIIEALLDALPVIIEEILAAIPLIIRMLIDMLPDIIQAVVDMIPVIIEAVIEAIPLIIMAVVDAIPEIIVAVIELIPVVITAICDAIPQIIDTVIKAIPDIIAMVIELIPEIIESLVEAIPDIIEAVVEAIPQIIEAVISMIPLIIEAVIEGIPLIIAALVEGIAKAIGGIFSGIGGIFGGLFSGWGKSGKSGSEIYRDTLKELERGDRTSYDTVSQLQYLMYSKDWQSTRFGKGGGDLRSWQDKPREARQEIYDEHAASGLFSEEDLERLRWTLQLWKDEADQAIGEVMTKLDVATHEYLGMQGLWDWAVGADKVEELAAGMTAFDEAFVQAAQSGEDFGVLYLNLLREMDGLSDETFDKMMDAFIGMSESFEVMGLNMEESAELMEMWESKFTDALRNVGASTREILGIYDNLLVEDIEGAIAMMMELEGVSEEMAISMLEDFGLIEEGIMGIDEVLFDSMEAWDEWYDGIAMSLALAGQDMDTFLSATEDAINAFLNGELEDLKGALMEIPGMTEEMADQFAADAQRMKDAGETDFAFSDEQIDNFAESMEKIDKIIAESGGIEEWRDRWQDAFDSLDISGFARQADQAGIQFGRSFQDRLSRIDIAGSIDTRSAEREMYEAGIRAGEQYKAGFERGSSGSGILGDVMWDTSVIDEAIGKYRDAGIEAGKAYKEGFERFQNIMYDLIQSPVTFQHHVDHLIKGGIGREVLAPAPAEQAVAPAGAGGIEINLNFSLPEGAIDDQEYWRRIMRTKGIPAIQDQLRRLGRGL